MLAALAAALTLDDDHSRLYYDLLMQSLSEASLRALESYMDIAKYEYQSDFARKYYGQGKAEGKAEGIATGFLAVLASRGLDVSPALRDRVLATTDVAVLGSWLTRAVRATSLGDVFDLD